VSFSLQVTRDGRSLDLHTFPVSQERVVIGRHDSCDVRLDGDGVSRQHCELVLEAGFHRLSDLGSSHGTFLNGRRASEASLEHGDVLTIGAFQLAYASQLEPQAAPRPAATAAQGLPTLEAPLAPTAQGPARTRRTAHVLYERDGALETSTLQQTTFLIGRGRGAQLRLTKRRDPRVAAMILREPSGFRVWDTSPRGNAVTVNGRSVRDAELRDGDLLVVSGRPLRFRTGLPKLDALAAVEVRDVLRPKKQGPS
jgi:pSer/pThr/pTyr-binding forkhead associated (FHA) protein